MALAMLETWTSFGYHTYALALSALWGAFAGHRWLRERNAVQRHTQSIDAGTVQPVSLHPLIDPATCVGCGACTHACPEGNIIGMIGGKAHLLDPSACVGHGACKTACPVGAIELVFGSARRGVDIPVVSPTFESNVPGLFIAGELGGMGLIANAIEQGRQAIAAIEPIARRAPETRAPDTATDLYDVVIVGGGPAGIAASLAAKDKSLRALTLEQDALGGTVAHYPRGKVVMTRPAILPLFGKVHLRRVRKERLLGLWQKVISDTGIQIHNGIRVEHIEAHTWGFEVTTSAGPCRAKTILLATGRRGSPRRLDVPGEDLPKVVYRLDHPAQYRGLHVLVVGGGDSALEAAVALSKQDTARVTLCYRGANFHRATPNNRHALEHALAGQRLAVVMNTAVRVIESDRVIVEQAGATRGIRNDVVIVCAGGLLPTSLLANLGVRVETKYGTA
jgi:thioredoxin reductase (NADPH)